MKVIKRDGRHEAVKFDKIVARMRGLMDMQINGEVYNFSPLVDPAAIARDIISYIHDGIHTYQIDEVAASNLDHRRQQHPDFGVLARRIFVSNLHKSTPKKFSDAMRIIDAMNNTEQEIKPVFKDIRSKFIKKYSHWLDAMIKSDRDYQYDCNALKTLIKSYLYTSGRCIDRPQYMLMRLAVALFMREDLAARRGSKIDKAAVGDRNSRQGLAPVEQECLNKIEKYYNVLSEKKAIHGSPALFNACRITEQLSSCFLTGTQDSIEGIMKNITNVSYISKAAGGISISMGNIRPEGSLIKGTGGRSKGIPKQLKLYDAAASCWDQGGDKRKGAFAVYLPMHHGDLLKFVKQKLPSMDEELRCPNLNYGLWMSDLFMERLMAGEKWSFFNHNTAPLLFNAHGAEYKRIYEEYEAAGKAIDVMKAEDVLDNIYSLWCEQGQPYVCMGDNVNRKSNQSFLGTINSSNLCTEIMEWSDDNNYATCTLATVSLPAFFTPIAQVKQGRYYAELGADELRPGYCFDFDSFAETVELCIEALDNVISINVYPVKECINLAHTTRPIGLGIQGLADLFCMFRIPFISAAAERLYKRIVEVMYHAAITASCNLVKAGREKYTGFERSPMGQGIFQFDMWESDHVKNNLWERARPTLNWRPLKDEVAAHGLRNSLLLAFPPTVATSAIMGNNESFEPFQSNIYQKSTLGGSNMIINEHMMRHLDELGLLTENIMVKIIENGGSVQRILEIPESVREIYKTVWEIRHNDIMTLNAIISTYVCQATSLNAHIASNSRATINAVLIKAYKLGLKTAMYYFRSQPAIEPLKLGEKMAAVGESCSRSNPDCKSCSG